MTGASMASPVSLHKSVPCMDEFESKVGYGKYRFLLTFAITNRKVCMYMLLAVITDY